MNRVKKFTALVVVLAAIYFIKIKPRKGKVAHTASGPVRGTVSISRDGREFYEWLGVPYAAPPIGELRFASPRPIEPWDAVMDTTSYGPACAQIHWFGLLEVGHEDCLTLNVHVPKLAKGLPLNLLPIMVHIHGGGFAWGTSSDNRPDYFMDHDVILVTVNYRLGPFGFLRTEDSSATGNMGLKDQSLAIKWVYQNAEVFGGDPNRITLVGESAGGASVQFQMLLSQTKGISKVIALSGSATCSWAFEEPEKAIEKAKETAEFLNCLHEDHMQMIACLRNVSASDLLSSTRKNMRDFFALRPQREGHLFTPTIEATNSSDAFLTERPLQSLLQGKAQRIPLLTGVVANEGLLAVWSFYNHKKNLESFEAKFEERVTDVCNLHSLENKTLVVKAIKGYYFPPDLPMTHDQKLEAYKSLFGDCFFNFGVHFGAEIQRRFSNVYLYFFNLGGGPSLVQALTSYGDTFAPQIEATLTVVKMYVTEILLGIPREDIGISHNDDVMLAFPTAVMISKGHAFYEASKRWVKFLVDFASHDKPALGPLSKDGPLKYWEFSEDLKLMLPTFVARLEYLRSIGVK